jgi:hypothetical protein
LFFAVFFLANWLFEFTKLPLEWLMIAVLTSAAGWLFKYNFPFGNLHGNRSGSACSG